MSFRTIIGDRWYTHKELVKMVDKVKRYEEALKFYANDENYEAWSEYEDATGYFNNVDFDSGDKAKDALGENANKKDFLQRDKGLDSL